MKKILIVEDAAFMQKAIRGVLGQKYEVVCASSGPEAIGLYAKERPDLVLSELIMPQMSGLELQRELTDRHEQIIPFMFMADDGHEENERLGLESGALDYIGKPFKPEVLLRRVDNIMRQIDSLRQIQGLKIVAETDPMTGLLNKMFAQKTLAELCARSSGVLMMIDLDNFKLVNDLYGHGMGDRVLIRFGEILRGVIRASDVAGRVGGDEFIVFCRDVRSERLIVRKADSINSALLASAKEFMGEDMNIPLGASVGAVFVPDEGTDFSELYKKADRALYSVKRNGKHGCAFFREHTARGAAGVREGGSTPLASARKILGERNRQKGAYEVGFESFRTIYRFFIREMENYHYDAELVVFSFGPGVSDNVMEAFGALLRQSLRRSDIYAKSGDSQYMVLLPQPIPDHGHVAINRILDSWAKLDEHTTVSCEHESVTLPVE